MNGKLRPARFGFIDESDPEDPLVPMTPLAMRIKQIIPSEKSGLKQALAWIVALAGFLCAAARLITAIYYMNAMPRSADPINGRVYRTGAAFNTAVFVNKAELQWGDFLNYGLMSSLGLGVIVLALFVIIPKARREGRL